jgi:hypothetical protein
MDQAPSVTFCFPSSYLLQSGPLTSNLSSLSNWGGGGSGSGGLSDAVLFLMQHRKPSSAYLYNLLASRIKRGTK